MSLVKGINCDTLKHLGDGTAEGIINSAIATAIADLIDRGSDGAERVVTIKIKLKSMDNMIAGQVAAAATVPPYKCKPTVFKPALTPTGEQVLLFQSDNAESPDQGTLFQGEPDPEEVQE